MEYGPEINILVKFVYSEKATKFWEIATLLLSTAHTDKSKVEILQNFVAFLGYMNFTKNDYEKWPKNIFEIPACIFRLID